MEELEYIVLFLVLELRMEDEVRDRVIVMVEMLPMEVLLELEEIIVLVMHKMGVVVVLVVVVMFLVVLVVIPENDETVS